MGTGPGRGRARTRLGRLRAAADGPRIGTRDLILAAFPDGQIIDGELRGYAGSDDTEPFVVIAAVDSTDWDVDSAHPGILARVREAYADASEID